MTFGLVLSGGGVRGAAHIGVLKALHESGLKPSMISGTSAGSMVAGLYSYGYTPDEMMLIARQISRNYYDVDLLGIINAISRLILRKPVELSGLLEGNILEKRIRCLTKGAPLNKARIPTAITAVDINNTNIVVFTSYPARLVARDDYVFIHQATFAEAIRASIAIPGIFKPKMFQGMRLVDGGVLANVPVEIARRMGAKKVLAVNLGYNGHPVDYVDNFLEISLQAIDIMMYHLNRPRLEDADFLLTPAIGNVGDHDLSQIDYIIKCGYQAARKVLPDIEAVFKS